MQKDPEKRPSADDILQHNYFKGVRPTLPPKVFISIFLKQNLF